MARTVGLDAAFWGRVRFPALVGERGKEEDRMLLGVVSDTHGHVSHTRV